MPSFNPVNSSNIAAIAYDANSNSLTVRFIGGAEYKYSDVPADVYEYFLNSGSPGGYFAANIKDVYEYRRIG